ncbi:S-layer homology domain-containing protein [Leptolyngbya sp. Heron Island J]|uniref:S-layer homology domain-containing protein n=1 Tax=Leptolyngbya sp. Heron Island J TaxID=1385935 RepID=UPI001268AE4B|nr:S-layer homology domain-containing protein [Leptolyngbya sp. Heron Island J]
MSQIPSDQGTSDNRRRSVTYDELIAMFVAFLTLGSVLFWGLTRSGVNLFGNAGLFNLDDAAPLVEDLDSNSQLNAADEGLADDEEAEPDDVLGFGTAELIGEAGADDILEEITESLEAVTEMTPPNTPTQPAMIPGSDAVTSPLPRQAAQPAAPEPTDDATAPISALPLEPSREALEFNDVPDDYWAKSYIDALSERLVIDGISEGTFAPEEPVTRAQLASAIAQAFPLGDEQDAIAFSDIETDYWATEAIDKAVKGGFMSGFPNERFQPNLPVPRAQVLTALVTGLNADDTPENVQAILERYDDAAEIPEWAIGKMAAATQSNIVVNHPDLAALNPNQPATRAEVAAMIYQTLAAQGRVETIDGVYVVEP